MWGVVCGVLYVGWSLEAYVGAVCRQGLAVGAGGCRLPHTNTNTQHLTPSAHTHTHINIQTQANTHKHTQTYLHTHQVPLEYKILGYTAEDFPGLTPYAPQLTDQPLLLGAPEEEGGAGPSAAAGGAPSGVLPAALMAEVAVMPDVFSQAPFTILEIGNRWGEGPG